MKSSSMTKRWKKWAALMAKYLSPLRDLNQRVQTIAREHPTWSQVHEVFKVLDDHLSARARLEEINQNRELRGQ